jgi:hypothetical protein
MLGGMDTRPAGLRSIHAAAQMWLKWEFPTDPARGAVNRAYADLMFAFGSARLGDADAAGEWVRAATEVLEPAAGPHPLLLRAFRYRIDQALAGRPHAGPLPADWWADRAAFLATDQVAVYAIDRMLQRCRTAQADAPPDPYADWLAHANESARLLRSAFTRHHWEVPPSVAEELLGAVEREASEEYQEGVYHSLAESVCRLAPAARPRVLAGVAGCYRRALAAPGRPDKVTDWRMRLVRLAASAIEAARQLPDPDEIDRWLWTAADAVLDGWCRDDPVAAGRLVGNVVRSARRAGATAAVAVLADRLAERFPPDAPPADRGSAALRLAVATAARAVGWPGLTEPTVAAARTVFVPLPRQHRDRPNPQEIAAVAVAAVEAILAAEGAAEVEAVVELLRGLPELPNTFNTAPYFSRLHLDILDALVMSYPGVWYGR